MRVVPAGWKPADPASTADLEDLAWDRGKRFVSAPGTEALHRLALRADVLLDDSPAGTPRPAGLDAESLLAASPALAHVTMPPYGPAGRWRDLPADPLLLSALTVDFFLPALAALDRMDVMVMPGVDGEFTNLMLPGITSMAGAELERTFAQRPREEWLAILADAGVPAAPVCSREEWLDGEILATAAPPVTMPHPVTGPVVLPGAPIAFSGTPARIGPLPTAGRLAADEELRADAAPRPRPEGSAPELPLSGLRVVDLSTFLAAPFTSTLLAELGATVVKVETPRRDPYSAFATSYTAVNHAKTVASANLRDPAGLAALLELAGEADVLVDNLRPAAAARLGLTDDVLASAAPRAVRCSVSAFGRSGPFADLPGFDPVLQSRSGIAAAQGGDDEPVNTSAPTIDVGTGALMALGALAALVARQREGRGQHVTTSLAATAAFLQVKELTTYEGRPPAETGGRDYRGPEPARRYHRAADGWLAIAATESQAEAVAGLLGLAALSHGAVADAIAAKPAEHWLAEFARLGIQACTVAPRAGLLSDPYLTENDFTHVVRDPVYGRFRLIRGYVRAVDTPRRPASAAPVTAAADWPRLGERLESAGTVHPGYQVLPGENGAP